jgi:hypothetical protein
MLLFPVLPKQKLLNCLKDFASDREESERDYTLADNLWKEYLFSIRVSGNTALLIANAIKIQDP